MGRDYPDWGGRFKSQNQMMLYDLAELAARLGSPVSFERTGRVMFATDFQDGLGEFLVGVSFAYPKTQLSTQSYSGPFSCRLYPGNALDDVSRINRYEPPMSATPFGVAALVRTAEQGGAFIISVSYAHNADSYQLSSVKWITETGEIQVLTDVSIYETIYTIDPVSYTVPIWNFVKLVCNPIDDTLTRFQINDHLINMEDYPTVLISTPFYQTTAYWFTAQTTVDGVSADFYLDRVIYTVDEPLNN